MEDKTPEERSQGLTATQAMDLKRAEDKLAAQGTPQQSPNAIDLATLDPMMQFFSYQHLPPRLQGASKLFHDVAANIVLNMPRNPERTVALRKLLEAKDAGVRCIIYKGT